MTKKLVLGVLALTLAGCAGMQRAYVEQVCNENGGYQQGMNDARGGMPMDLSFTRMCAVPARDPAARGYRDGYNAGLAAARADAPAQINVNFGGHDSHKAFYCEIHAFMKTFSAWGETELEAQVEAQKRCTAEYNEMHCQEAQCRRS